MARRIVFCMEHNLPSLPARDAHGHKGTFGTVCVIGGQAQAPRLMIGGPAFSALAALRSGAGLAVLAVPEPILHAAMIIAPSATGLALPVGEDGAIRPSDAAALLDEQIGSFHCIAIGPGLGAAYEQQQLVVRLLAQDERPLVIDADAINAMARMHDVQQDLRAPAVLTPHPGEYRRLADALGIQLDASDPRTRPEAAIQLAQRLGCVVVLKGSATIVSDGIEVWTNPTGNAALATAGSGDVLTGILAGLIAQFGSASRFAPLSLFDCARLGVYLHGMAADHWAERHGTAGMLATDLLDLLPAAMRELRGN